MEEKERFQNHIYFIISLVAAFSVILVVQLFRWQVIHHETFRQLADEVHQKEKIIRPQRGNITDRNGYLLAIDSTRYSVSASPELISDPYKAADRIFNLIHMPRETLLMQLTSSNKWVLLGRDVSYEVGQKIQMLDINGIILDGQAKRVYPEGALAAHLLGFVNDTDTGYYGIEGFYNSTLQGTPGKRYSEYDPFGFIIPLGPYQLQPSLPGKDISLTIDRTAQYIAERKLAEGLNRYGAKSGTVIVMQPKTGAILAMASLPTYDPNDYMGSEEAMYANPAVNEQYEPGSVFKIITMASALDAKAVTPESTINDTGGLEVGGRMIRNWDLQAHGIVDMTTVLAKSLNVGASQIALKMGKERFYNYVRRFGFGASSEIDLQGEASRYVKNPGGTDWYESDLATNSFGQGIAVTPIQMINSVAAVANNGFLMKPHVVQSVVENGQVTPMNPAVIRKTISSETAHTLTEMLATALESESSTALVPGYKVAGKTGTAEVPIPGGYDPDHSIASFIGYLPAEDPELIILIILREPTSSRWGSETAAPLFAELAKELVNLFDIPPDDIRLAQQ
jgi:cell division protein FtsI/penicillin-binding protein 2